jgi:hypothetical protein
MTRYFHRLRAEVRTPIGMNPRVKWVLCSLIVGVTLMVLMALVRSHAL